MLQTLLEVQISSLCSQGYKGTTGDNRTWSFILYLPPPLILHTQRVLPLQSGREEERTVKGMDRS